MYREPILREVALVSYGTLYLRGDVALDDWYRHNVFEGATVQFRDLAENALLAETSHYGSAS
ncbi:hypothetical protein IP92_04915 [Pseudoduganella flava]|uniref:Uncharacterized protein n=1 Tax=Pseudoduganella flava TaxID=871742 RepID=A0A562PFY9_9BURK|nr:hypothetical protein [Pseudoduganella flava]QGZ40178.1 hypothetical protein GO485_14735 [Pseudoduganella flava]TWI43354.1 hypothetical protein IP92_04915 [Pseudoduganella flava]